jgi:hypothetical protein
MFAQTTREIPEWVTVLKQFANLKCGSFLFVSWFMGFGIGLIFTFLFWHLQVSPMKNKLNSSTFLMIIKLHYELNLLTNLIINFLGYNLALASCFCGKSIGNSVYSFQHCKGLWRYAHFIDSFLTDRTERHRTPTSRRTFQKRLATQ